MAIVNVSGNYSNSKANWWSITDPGQSINNYQRWVIAHSTILNDLPNASSYFTRSFSFSIPPLFPTDDDSLRAAANAVGQGIPASQGGDFLRLGNYVSPTAIVTTINGIAIPGGKIYFAGQASGAFTAITRAWIEVLSTANLTTLIPLIDGNQYTVQYNFL